LAETPVGSIQGKKPDWRGQRGPATAPSQRLVSSGAEYTPLTSKCQYVVAIFFYNAIECVS
jgi:hypothetical protein